MKKTTIVTIILGVLVLISVVQAFQLNGLKTNLEEGQVSISSSGSSAPVSSGGTSGGTGSLPSSIKDLPTMVGGC